MTKRNRMGTARAWRIARVSLATVVASLGLASCGGSDNNNNDNGGSTTPPAASNTPPATASQSVSGFIAYLQTVVPTTPENTQPLDVSTFVAPTDDMAQPTPI